MSDTPRTDEAWKPDGGDGYPTVDVDFSRKLERELNAAKERINRLEEAGDELLRESDDDANINRWLDAKEAKP